MTVVNQTNNVFSTKFGDVVPDDQSDFCFESAGVKRVKLTNRPFPAALSTSTSADSSFV